ncbi:MAG: hypothetical protein IJG41_00480, partial [Bacteroidales bacterium]|nr:hypothetical protein [Bacteroidales bacterium]
RFVSKKKREANPNLFQICPDLFPRKKGKQIPICFRFVQICFQEKKGSKSQFVSDLSRFVSEKKGSKSFRKLALP